MSVWFTSDTHFGHVKVIDFCNRPYSNIDEMDNALIDNWNQLVSPGDIVYHLGDFSFYRTTFAIDAIVRRLNGQIHLIWGNHDHKCVKRSQLFAWQGHYKRIKIEKQRIVLMHYAMVVWHGSHRGAWQLYGHSHGSLPDNPNMLNMDVGVDCFNYRPISYDTVANHMSQKHWMPLDHHDPNRIRPN